MEECISQSKTLNKPILFYFTGHACINSRKIEKNIFRQSDIFNLLKNDYIFIPVYCEEKANAQFQKQKFNTNFQPFIGVTDEKGEIKETIGPVIKKGELLDYLIKNK